MTVTYHCDVCGSETPKPYNLTIEVRNFENTVLEGLDQELCIKCQDGIVKKLLKGLKQ